MADVVMSGALPPNDPPNPGDGRDGRQPADRVDLPQGEEEEPEQGQGADEAQYEEEDVRYPPR